MVSFDYNHPLHVKQRTLNDRVGRHTIMLVVNKHKGNNRNNVIRTTTGTCKNNNQSTVSNIDQKSQFSA